MNENQKLLHDYARTRSEAAFRELVTRYIDLVYSVALRRLSGDVHAAQDVAQTVFTDLAKKARTLPSDIMLGGWLHRHCCFVASTMRRGEMRRMEREREAMNLHSYDEPGWKELAPVLDEAIEGLETSDREAIILRFFEQRDLRTVGESLGISDDAAQKRVSRAVEKLRNILTRRGVGLSAGVLAGLLVSQSVAAVPQNWASHVASQALENAASKVPFAASLTALFGLPLGKVALALAVAGLLTTGLVLKKRSSALQSTSAPLAQAAMAKEGRPTVDAATASEQNSVPPSPQNSTAAVESVALRITIVAADSNQPIPDVPFDYRGWAQGKFSGKQLAANRAGICEVSYPSNISDLELTTRVDGFADTKLHWRPDRGDKIPVTYTLRLVRPVEISGRVLNEQDEPVADAKVGFNHEDDPNTGVLTESHDFGWIEVSTDDEGKWTINRVAPEMLRRLYGSAHHPEYTGSKMLFLAREPAEEEQLRGGTHVFRLGNAVIVRGFVMNSHGTALPDAKVSVGAQGAGDTRHVTTFADGSFEARGCKPGKGLVSAEAKGYAPATIEAELSTDTEPVRVVLSEGKILKLRVVNSAGEPIPGANVWLDTFGHGPTSTRSKPLIQVEFAPITDAEGRIVWNEAPDAELTFQISASKYMRVDGYKVRPEGPPSFGSIFRSYFRSNECACPCMSCHDENLPGHRLPRQPEFSLFVAVFP